MEMRGLWLLLQVVLMSAGVFSSRRMIALAMLVGVVAAVPIGSQAAEVSEARITFDAQIKKIFREKCISCHNSDDREGELDLSSYRATMEGGASGAVVVPGDSLNSSLFSLVTHQDEPAMPPESPKISVDMIASIKGWIDGGALANAGSQVVEKSSRGLPLELTTRATNQPASPPMPPRLSLEPVVYTERGDVVRSMAVNPWSPLLAVTGSKQLILYHTKTLEPLGVLPFSEGTPEIVRFSSNGALLLAGGGRGGAEGRVLAWDVNSGERVFEVGDELDTVLAADISSDHALIALGGPKRVVRVYSTEDGKLKHELRKHVEWIYDTRFSPDTALLATADRNGSIEIWEAWSGQQYASMKGHGPGKIALAWRADSNVLASCGADGAVRLWEMEKGQQIAMWNAHKGGAVSIEFTKDGRLVTTGKDQVTRLWDATGKELQAFEKSEHPSLRTVYCESSARVLTGDFVGRISVWEAEGGDLVGQLVNHPPTLEMRIEAAESNDELLRRELLVQELVVDAALAKLGVAEQQASNISGLDDARRRVDAARTVALLARQQGDELDVEVANVEKRIKQIEKGLPNLQEAVRKADQSVRELGDDAEVRQVEQELRTLARRRLGELNNAKRRVVQLAATRRNLDPQIIQAESELEQARQTLESLEEASKPLRAAVQEKQQALRMAQERLQRNQEAKAAASAQVTRWKTEIEFSEQINDLTVRLQQALGKLAVYRNQQASILAQRSREADLLTAAQTRFNELSENAAEADDSRKLQLKVVEKDLHTRQDSVARLEKELERLSSSLAHAEAEALRLEKKLQETRRRNGE